MSTHIDTDNSSAERIIVVGNGMVGHHFLSAMASGEYADHYNLTTFSEEPRLAYDRVQLSRYFSGASAEDLSLTDEQTYQQHNIRYLLNDQVIAINRQQKTITTARGRCEAYDKLVLATGSYPFVPPVAGHDQPHCLVYRTIEDLEAISASAQQSRVGVVVGGGLLGLEAANALKQAGLTTHVVEFAPRLMAVQLDEQGGRLLRQEIEALGVSVHTDKNTLEIVAGEQCRYRMNFADGSFLETDMILFSAGIRPQDTLAKQAGLALGERGGIVINQYCQTSDADIYAIGECALWNNRIFGLVAPGYQMAKVALAHIQQSHTGVAEVPQFQGADMSTKLKLLGVDVASIGDAQGQTEGARSFVFQDDINKVYKRLVISADGKKLLGAVLVGDVDAYGTLLQLKLNDMTLPADPAGLILPAADNDAASAGLGVNALPDSAQICSCFDVTKADIASAVNDGCCTMADIKQQTQASSGCGGCSALTKQVMDNELAAWSRGE